MEPLKRPFDSIVCELIGLIDPGSKRKTYVFMCMHLLINYPIVILIPDKTADTVIQASLQQVNDIFGGSFTLITHNGKELKNDLFQKVASEPGIKPFFEPSPPTIQWHFRGISFISKSLCLKIHKW